MSFLDDNVIASADRDNSRATTAGVNGTGSYIAGPARGAKSRRPASIPSRQTSTDSHLRIIADAVLDGPEGTRRAAIGMAAVGSSVVEVSSRLDGIKTAVESQLTALLHMRALSDRQEQLIRAQQPLQRGIGARAESLDKNVKRIEILVAATTDRFIDFISIRSMINVMLTFSLFFLAVGVAVVIGANLLLWLTRTAQTSYPESPIAVGAVILVSALYFGFGWFCIGQQVGYRQYWVPQGNYRHA